MSMIKHAGSLLLVVAVAGAACHKRTPVTAAVSLVAALRASATPIRTVSTTAVGRRTNSVTASNTRVAAPGSGIYSTFTGGGYGNVTGTSPAAAEVAGLVERRVDMFDGRRRALWITRAGLELLAEASDELTGVDAQFTERLGEDTLAALAELPPPRLSAIEHALLAAGWD